MTNEERKALVERLRWGGWYFDDPVDGKAYASDDPLDAADQIEADGKRIAELQAAGERLKNYNRELRGSKARVYAATDLRNAPGDKT